MLMYMHAYYAILCRHATGWAVLVGILTACTGEVNMVNMYVLHV
jgi:hypothetical protein